jgi:hypothetical protein
MSSSAKRFTILGTVCVLCALLFILVFQPRLRDIFASKYSNVSIIILKDQHNLQVNATSAKIIGLQECAVSKETTSIGYDGLEMKIELKPLPLTHFGDGPVLLTAWLSVSNMSGSDLLIPKKAFLLDVENSFASPTTNRFEYFGWRDARFGNEKAEPDMRFLASGERTTIRVAFKGDNLPDFANLSFNYRLGEAGNGEYTVRANFRHGIAF